MRILSNSNRRFSLSSNSKVIAVLTPLHIVFIILFDKVTAFAPDENGYIEIFKNLYKSDFSLEGYKGWPEGSINALRLVYLPAKALEFIGFSDFYSVRLLTVFYSMLALSLLLRLSLNLRFLGQSSRFWIGGAYFLPSYFLWTSIGLREGFIFLGLIGIFYGMRCPASAQTIVNSIVVFTSVILLLISKPYIYVLFVLALLMALITISLLRKKLDYKSVKISILCLIPLLLFPSISSTIVANVKNPMNIGFTSLTPTPTLTPTSKVEIPTGGQTLHDLSQQLDNNIILDRISKVTGFSRFLEEKSKKSYLRVGSEAQEKNSLQLKTQPASLMDPLSIFKASFHFLFEPVPFLDNGSLFLNLQSYESFAWYIYYVLFVILVLALLRGKFELNLNTIASTYFTLGFIVLSSLIEVNDGTSVRHRSVLLVGILIMLATLRYRNNESKPPVSINSDLDQ